MIAGGPHLVCSVLQLNPQHVSFGLAHVLNGVNDGVAPGEGPRSLPSTVTFACQSVKYTARPCG